ncbi:hypothetical protein NX059_002326 [Plenodomus lindquistii]|nr:hypothetical protein NX059_002326 [Plenodomus lindquistii]
MASWEQTAHPKVMDHTDDGTRTLDGRNSASAWLSSKDSPVLSGTWTPESAKRKGTQSRIPLEARQILEDEFASNPYPCSWEMDIVAHQANLEIKRVRNWYNNTRARKKVENSHVGVTLHDHDELPGGSKVLKPKLSKDSLEAMDKHADTAIHTPQPSLNKYLAQSYQEDAVELDDLQSAMDRHGDILSDNLTFDPSRRGSVITSVTSASSSGTAPTMYTVSSNGSHSGISSFGRERRRGRRRMAWKDTTYSQQRINGVNNAGQPQKDLPFFCTFCKRAFKTKYEWLRHEDSVHALRTTWICCDTKGAGSLESCPFCGQKHPDDAHMAGHKFQHCRSQPESKRTFYRRDHFVQHLHHVHFTNVKHPSVRVGCQARLLGTEGGSYFGCKELTLKWRRFGAPMKRDDPMMHCGFCGKISKDWTTRCAHVAEHLRSHLDRSSWWADRKETHLENLYSTTAYESFRCRYCQKVFTDVQAMNEHSHCRVWSCRFLQNFDDLATDAGPLLYAEFPSTKSHHCNLCGTEYRNLHVEHAERAHRYRDCNQEFYTSEEAFLQHLHNFHGAAPPHMLQASSVVEQGFMRNKGASFEPVEFNESWQPCLIDLTSTPIGPFMVDIPSSTKQPTANTSKQRPNVTKLRGEHPLIPLPRYYRLSILIPYLSSRIFFTRNDKPVDLPRTNHTVFEEMKSPHVTSLAMSAGLVSMAAVRWVIKPELQLVNGMTELKLEGSDD